MKIGQLAEFAGTTTRTVRHYHRLGLLPEPVRQSNGYRNYTVADGVRLLRIRRLAGNGVPLGSVAAILADQKTSADERDVVADLRALITNIDHEQAALARRRAALTAMLADAEQGIPLSALPTDLVEAFDAAISSAPSTAVGAALRYERDLMEGLVLSGNAADDILAAYGATLTDEAQRTRYLALLERWSDLEGRPPYTVTGEIESIANALREMFSDADVPLYLAGEDVAHESSFSLDDVIPDPARREVIRLVQEALFTGPTSGGDTR